MSESDVLVQLGRIEAKIDMLLGNNQRSVQDRKAPTPFAFHKMTTKQHASLQMLLRGRSNQEIADRLGVSVNTAKVHVRGLAAHFGVTTRTQIVLSAKEAFDNIDASEYLVMSGGLPKTWDQHYKEPDPYIGLYRRANDEDELGAEGGHLLSEG